MQDNKEMILSVPDMSCEHCVHTINSTLGTLDGVRNVNIDLPAKTVRLQYQPDQLSREQVETALDDAGYTVAK